MFHKSGPHLSRPRKGASLTEFGLLVGLIAVVSIVSIEATGNRISSLFSDLGSQMTDVSNTVGGNSSGTVTETTNDVSPNPDGAFVLTAGAFNGNLGGFSGANALCAQDLNANDWLGKESFSQAQIDGATAFLCDSGGCQMPDASKQYTMATSGSPTSGGHTFTTSANASGPSDNKNWTDADAFGVDTHAWSNATWVSSSQWANGMFGSSCSGWTDDSSATNGTSGRTNDTDMQRWQGVGTTCDTTRRLLCFVD